MYPRGMKIRQRNYKEEIGKINVICDIYDDLNNEEKIIKLIDDTLKSTDGTLYLKLGYTVGILKKYYYEPYIKISKVDGYITEEMKRLSYSLSELKKCTHDKVHNNKFIYKSFNTTYLRDCDDDEWCPKMPRFVSDYDKYIRILENRVMEYFKCEVDQFYDTFVKSEEILYRDVHSIYIRAQDSYLHNNSVGQCYYFEIIQMGARYYAES